MGPSHPDFPRSYTTTHEGTDHENRPLQLVADQSGGLTLTVQQAMDEFALLG